MLTSHHSQETKLKSSLCTGGIMCKGGMANWKRGGGKEKVIGEVESKNTTKTESTIHSHHVSMLNLLEKEKERGQAQLSLLCRAFLSKIKGASEKSDTRRLNL